MTKDNFIFICKDLLNAKETGLLGDCVMPEDANPGFNPEEKELRLAYFTLPMALNYQRDSYKLWDSALKTYGDPETAEVFDLKTTAIMPIESLRQKLSKHRLALQPNKHIHTWKTLSATISENWGGLEKLFSETDTDFLQLRAIVQGTHKKQFPYLSGPKLFNYWSFIIREYGEIPLKNSEYVEVAPDTHIIKCTVRLGLISEEESTTLSREEISARWRKALEGSGINPIEMHPALWFWSRGGFSYQPAA